jgi:DNA-binding HxlR family transcriptional regulator
MSLKKSISDPVACVGDILALQDALDVLGGKWRLRILHYLLIRKQETNTFKKIEKDVVGISAKVLSKELKELEFNGLVHREVMDSKPVTVRYSITPYGEEIKSVLSAFVNWGARHRQKMVSDS